MELPVKTRRPPSLPFVCVVFPDHSSFSVLRETPMASAKNIQFQKAKVLQILKSKGVPMTIKSVVGLALLLAILPAFTGCWYAAAAGAGAYGGYKMKEKGYTVQSPVTKEKSDRGEDKEESK
jgi:hypothetical protein